jgi:hypothetical protein
VYERVKEGGGERERTEGSREHGLTTLEVPRSRLVVLALCWSEGRSQRSWLRRRCIAFASLPFVIGSLQDFLFYIYDRATIHHVRLSVPFLY